jgi:hypothetical protein
MEEDIIKQVKRMSHVYGDGDGDGDGDVLFRVLFNKYSAHLGSKDDIKYFTINIDGVNIPFLSLYKKKRRKQYCVYINRINGHWVKILAPSEFLFEKKFLYTKNTLCRRFEKIEKIKNNLKKT